MCKYLPASSTFLDDLMRQSWKWENAASLGFIIDLVESGAGFGQIDEKDWSRNLAEMSFGPGKDSTVKTMFLTMVESMQLVPEFAESECGLK